MCEACCDGQDLGPGEKCNCCGRVRIVTGYRKYEYPMTEDDENRDIPITRIK